MTRALPIEADLAQLLRQVGLLVAGPGSPDRSTLDGVAALAEGFVARHRDALTFGAFPLPLDEGSALCSYDLTDDGAAPALRVNAIRAGVDSAVHDHGTWAVIVAVQGRERNRIYAPRGPSALPVFAREACVEPARPLVLLPHVFHSIHTDAEAPALQLHLYGRAPEGLARRLLDPATGQLLPLGAAA